MSLVFTKQIISDLVYHALLLIHLYMSYLPELTFWKLVNLVSHVSLQKGSRWLDAFRIFNNIS